MAFDDTTSNQIAVVTVSDLEGDTPNHYAYLIGQSWGVGSSDFNNGIVLLVKPPSGSEKGQVAIQIGYGLEGAIPDIYCKRIIESDILPQFKADDYYGGVKAACEELMALASGEISEPREEELPWQYWLYAAIFWGLIFLLIYWTIKGSSGGGGSNGGTGRRGPYIYVGPLDGGFGGGTIRGGSIGGGFGGGFGGGGFGGFGGGSFGGGGASGSW